MDLAKQIQTSWTWSKTHVTMLHIATNRKMWCLKEIFWVFLSTQILEIHEYASGQGEVKFLSWKLSMIEEVGSF